MLAIDMGRSIAAPYAQRQAADEAAPSGGRAQSCKRRPMVVVMYRQPPDRPLAVETPAAARSPLASRRFLHLRVSSMKRGVRPMSS